MEVQHVRVELRLPAGSTYASAGLGGCFAGNEGGQQAKRRERCVRGSKETSKAFDDWNVECEKARTDNLKETEQWGKQEHARLDADTEGQEEFKDILGNSKVQEWLSAMGLDCVQVEKVFTLFDINRDGALSPEDLIAGTLTLKGQAKATELAPLRARVEELTGKSEMSAGLCLPGPPDWSKHGL